MKRKIYLSYLCILILIPVSMAKINFQQEKESNLVLLKTIFQENIFPCKAYLSVFPVNFADMYPDAFMTLMKELNQYSTISLALLNITMNLCCGRYSLVLHNGNHTRELFLTLDSIGRTLFGFRHVLIWCDEVISAEHQLAISRKARTVNITELIFFYPSNKPPYQEINKIYSGSITVSVENVLLSKKTPWMDNRVTMNTNKLNIKQTVKQVNKQLTNYSAQLKKLPIKVLLFLRPLSVEENHLENMTGFRGVDFWLLQVLTHLLNISYTLEFGRPSQYGGILRNGTYCRPLLDIIHGHSDLNINRYPMEESELNAVVIPHSDDKYCFIVRMPKRQVRSWSVSMAFQLPVWIILFGVYVACFMLYMTSIYFFIGDPKWTSITFVQSTVSVTHLPLMRSDHRITWALWLVFTFLINNIFITSFVTQLIPEEKTHRFKTLDDLMKGNLTLLSEIGQFQVSHYALIMRKLKPFHGRAHEIDGHTALLTSRLTRFVLYKMFPAEFYTVDECAGQNYVGPLIAPSHQIFLETAKIIHRFSAAGLLEYWVKINLISHVFFVKNASQTNVNINGATPLKLEELENFFKFFLFALATSVIVFICEILFYKVAKLKDKKPSRKIVLVFPYIE